MAEASKAVEIEGRRWLFQQRVIEGVTETSFDGGKSWAQNSAQAFRTARDADTLQPETPEDAGSNPEDMAALTVELLGRIRALKAGEQLKVVHYGHTIAILKDRLLSSFRPSLLEETGVEPIADDDGD